MKEMSRISKMYEMYFCKIYAFIEVSKYLDKYRSENNFIESSK